MTYRRPEPLGKQHRLDDFRCGEPALDEWLKRHARSAHASDSARVFVATVDDRETVVGYYALAAARVAPEGATARQLKGQPRARPLPAILLARLAVEGLPPKERRTRLVERALARVWCGWRTWESPQETISTQ